ncbi:MAG: dihydrodipicolinate synthase family protein [Chthoniobacterales bacterium]
MTTLATPETLTEASGKRGKETAQAPRNGIHVALWIPFDENGNLKRQSMEAHLEWLKNKGIHGVLGLGSTGEFARMNLPQREAVLEAIIELSAPLPVIANISSINLSDVVALGCTAKRLGAVGVALMPPPFFPLPQEDILAFFLRAAESIDLPFYLYNYPEVTGNRIGLEVIEAFADQANMVGIKQSGSELPYHDDLIALGRKKDFSVFTAADPLLGTYLDKGASGCLGGMTNFLPEYMLEVYEMCRAGKSSEAATASERLLQAGKISAPLCLPHNVRAAVEARGIDTGAFKTVVSSDTLALYSQIRDSLRQTFADWELPAF